MDDPAQAIEDAFDGIKDYAQKTFESVKTIITGIFDLIEAKREEAEAKERLASVTDKWEKKILAGEAYVSEADLESGRFSQEFYDALEAKRMATGISNWGTYTYRDSKNTKVEVSGTIKYEGVNDKGELIGAGQMTEEQLARMFQTQGRLY